MGSRWGLLTVVAGLLALVCVVEPSGSNVVRACSCAVVDPVDAVGAADVVFTGRAVGNEGSEFEPVWEFEVDGVVKGNVDRVEVVGGDDWAAGCGTDFSQFDQSVVVYASTRDDQLGALACMPTPTAVEFAERIDAIKPPSGTGQPAAVLAGTVGLSDIAVLDGHGRALAHGSIGVSSGVVAHCPGTTRAAVVSSDPASAVTIVELTTLSVGEQRPIANAFQSFASSRAVCLRGTGRVVATSGYGPDQGSVTVATSNPKGSGVEDVVRTFEDVSRAVLHPQGTVILLPTAVDEPVRTLASDGLRPAAGAEVDLPSGSSAIDGDVSPSGSRLAMLVTLSGGPVRWDTGATHVVTVEVDDGVPVAGTAVTVELAASGGTIEDRRGAAKWIRWVDDSTWVIESETRSSKLMEFVATDGSQVLGQTNVGWGWNLTPLSSGVLRARNGGVEVVGRDGTAVVGDPAPLPDRVDRQITLAHLIDAPAFQVAGAHPIEPPTITPIAASGSPSAASPNAPATTARNDDNFPTWVIVAAVVLVVVTAGAGVARRRSRRC